MKSSPKMALRVWGDESTGSCAATIRWCTRYLVGRYFYAVEDLFKRALLGNAVEHPTSEAVCLSSLEEELCT